MAKMTNTSTYKIMFDGSQAENEVQRLRKQLKGVGEELAIVQEKFKGEREWDSGDTAEKLSKRIKELKKTQRSLKSALDAHITQITGVDSVLADRSAAAYNELTKKRTSLLNLLKRLRLDTEEEMRVYEETSKRLSKVQQEIGERDIDLKSPTTVARAQEVLARPEDYSTKEINEAIAVMTKFRDTKKADSEEWKHWNGYVRNGALFMEEFNQKVKTTNMEELHADLKNAKPTISDKDLNVLVKYWEEMAQGAKAGSTAQADFNKKLAEARDLQTARKREQGEKVVTEVADQGQFGSSLSEMQQRLKLLQDYRTVIDSTKPDAYVRVDAAIEKLTQKIKESQAGFLSYADAMKQAEGLANGTFKGNVSDLEKMKKSLEEYRETLKIDDTANLKKINAILDDIAKKQKELADINKREQSESKIAGVSGNIAGSSPAEIEEAIRLAKELQKMNGTSATQYQSLAKFINDAEAQLKKYNDQVKHAAMENQFLRLANLSKNALEEQRKYWQDVFDNAEKGTAKYIQAERKLVDINKTLTDRKSDEAGAILGNLPGSSVGDIERAVKMTEELMKAHSRGSAEYEIYAEEIKKAKEYLQSYVDMEKQVDMEDKWSRLRTLSTDALAEQKKYWQEMVNGAKQGTQELADYEAKLKDVVEEERMRLDNKATKVLADPTSFSVKEVQDSIKAYEQLRDAQRTGSGNWEYYNQKIEEARETLKHYNDEAKKTTMEGRLGGIATASTASIAEQKKYWQEMVDGAERGTQALKDYQDNLAKVTAEERTRLQNAAQQTITDYNAGNWNKTIGETKEAIKQLQEYRNTLNEKADSKALADVDKVLTELTQKTKEAELGFMSLEQALDQAELASKGQFQGTVEELQKLKKRLEEIRNTEIKIGDKDGLKKVDDALAKVDKKLDEVKNGVYDFNKAVNQPWSVSFNDLKRAAAQLEEELKNCTEDVENFAEKSNQLRNVNARIKDLNDRWKEHDGTLKSTIKRLASYVAVYGGFNFVWGKLKEAASANLQLSDSMADVQKTTAMTSAEIADLGKSLDAMDTRTSQAELYNLAATAGQLGIRGKESILGFVNASNMITVALNELGAEGTATLMKIADLTGDISEHGTEKALLKIGSAINELTASTTATAGPMVDFISRFGGVASAADIATHQMAAVGATADALKQEIEVTGTTMNKVVGAITSNTRELAAAVNVDYQALNELVKSGKTMDAIVMVFEAMSNAGGVSAEALKALGSEGDRMNRVITSFVGNLDMLKNNLRTSAAAFDEMTSIQNEYNIKNENAAALWERIQNTLLEIVSNPRFVGWLTDMLNSLKGFTDWLTQSEGAARLLIGTLLTLIGIKVVSFFTALGKSLYELKLMLASAKTWFTTLGSQFSALITLLGRTTGAVNILKTAIGGLFRILLKHPFLLVATAVGIAVTKFINFKDANEKAAEAAKALAEEEAKLINQFEEERSKAEQLATDIKKLNVSNDERKRLITEFNNAYGKYLGYMLDEKATAEEVAAAYDLVNAALTAKHQLELVGIKRSQRNQSFANEQVAYVQELRAALTNLGVDDANVSKTIAFVNTLVMQGKNASEILAEVNNLLGKNFKLTEVTGYRRNAEGQQVAFFNDTDLGAALKSYAEFGKQYKEDMQTLDEETQRINDNAVQERFKKQQDYLNTELENLKKLSTGTEEELKQTKQAYQSYFNTLKTYYSQATKEQKVELEKSLANLKDAMSKLPKLKELADSFTFDPWGKKDNLDNWTTFAETIKNLDKASPKSLAATLDAIEKESQDLSAEGLKNFNSMFQTTFDTTSIEKFNAQVKGLAKQIKDRLKELGRGTDGNFLWGSEGRGNKSAEREARQEMNAALAALEEHFLKRKAIVQQAYLDEKISGAEMQRQIADNDEEFRLARIELRKLLAGDANKFNQSLYPELSEKDLQRTSKMLQAIGDAVIDGLRKNVQKDEVEIREGAIKIRQAFEEELLKRDLFGKFENEFRNSLDNLELLSSDFERKTAQWMKDNLGISEGMAGLNEENQKKRLQSLINLSEKSYQINEQGMVDELAKNKEFAIWVQNLDAEQRSVLLQNLRNYYDQRLLIQKQYTERLGKEMEAWYEQSGQQKEYESTKTKIEKRTAENDILSGFGVDKNYSDEEKNITDQFVNEYNRLDSLREKALEHRDTLVEGSQEYIATSALIAQYEMKQNELLAQGQRDLTQVYMEEWQKRAERWGEWGEMFGDYLGEQVMLEKQANDARVRGDEEAAKEIEARQKKNKEELVKTALNKVVDLAAVWAKEFALKMMYNSLMEASDQQRTISEVTNQGKQTTLSILLDALKGQAHEHGKGLSGLVTGAIIFAATMALQAMAKSAIANMFPEAAAETNKATAGRLATGMLTYAEGNYPVLGNDGNVYNAKYEGSGMKTGIYRGGAHFGIFSEKKPEAIIDGDTTQRLIMNHPDIWKAIVTLSKNGRLDSGMGMRTFATGNINDLARQAQDMEASATTDNNVQYEMMQEMRALMSANLAIMNKLAIEGVHSNINMYGDDGLYKSMKKAEKYAGRVGYK